MGIMGRTSECDNFFLIHSSTTTLIKNAKLGKPLGILSYIPLFSLNAIHTASFNFVFAI